MGHIIAVTNLKGGIGKTTTVVNVGAGLALKGARVLLIDVDAQANLALALGAKPKRTLYDLLIDDMNILDCITPSRRNLDLLAADDLLLQAQPIISRRPDWSRALERALAPVKYEYDFILIDSPGSLTVLSVNAMVAASDMLVPTTVEHLSMKGLSLLFKQVLRVKNSATSIRVIVPTMYDARLRQSVELLKNLQETYGSLVVPPIRANVRLSESASLGRTIYEYDPRSYGALDYAHLVNRLSDMWRFTPKRAPAKQQPGGNTAGVTAQPLVSATSHAEPVGTGVDTAEPTLVAESVPAEPLLAARPVAAELEETVPLSSESVVADFSATEEHMNPVDVPVAMETTVSASAVPEYAGSDEEQVVGSSSASVPTLREQHTVEQPVEAPSREPVPEFKPTAGTSGRRAKEEHPMVIGHRQHSGVCPQCGRPLQRTLVAGYRVVFCDYCKYTHQELATGVRR